MKRNENGMKEKRKMFVFKEKTFATINDKDYMEEEDLKFYASLCTKISESMKIRSSRGTRNKNNDKKRYCKKNMKEMRENSSEELRTW